MQRQGHRLAVPVLVLPGSTPVLHAERRVVPVPPVAAFLRSLLRLLPAMAMPVQDVVVPVVVGVGVRVTMMVVVAFLVAPVSSVAVRRRPK